MYILLLGVLAFGSSALATPTCSLDQCSRLNHEFNYFPTNVEDLDVFCLNELNLLNCNLDVIKRCPENIPKTYKIILMEYKKIFDKLCIQSEFRSKFLRNAACIKENQSEIAHKCSKLIQHKGPCQNSDIILKCIRASTVEKCGEEAGEVNDVIITPMLKSVEDYCS